MKVIVDFSKPVIAQVAPLSLLEMLEKIPWPSVATCATQEIDGEILYWSVEDISQVKRARNSANKFDGLMPLLGIGSQVHSDEYLIEGEPVIAYDWSNAVVTLNDLTLRN